MNATIMPMCCKRVSSGLDKVDKTNFYLEKGYGVDLFKVQVENPDLHPNVVVFVNRRAMFLQQKVSL
jgi:hypothetical protein